MLRFILTGLCLLQFQVTYSSYVRQGSKPTCFPSYDPISYNDIREDPPCSKLSKDTFFILPPKTLHRFQPLFVKKHDLGAPRILQNPQTAISTSIDSEKREDFCDIKSEEALHANNVPEVLMVVATPPPRPQEAIYQEEAPKPDPSSVETQSKGDYEDLFEPLHEDRVVSSSGHNTESEDIRSESDDQASKLEEHLEFLEGSAESEGSSSTAQVNPITIDGESGTHSQLSGEPACTQLEIPQTLHAKSSPLDTICENASYASATEYGESSPPLLNTECVSPTTEAIVKESYSEAALPTVTDMGQISRPQQCPGIPNKAITGNPVLADISNQCTHVLSNMITGLSSINTQSTPSLVKPIYEEIIRHVPTVRSVIRHRLEETTHHVPVVERIVQHERQDIIRHIPIVQKFTRNVVECRKKHIPVIQHRTRTIEEPYIEHVPRSEKFIRPVIETLVKHVPVVFSRYKPVVHQRIRHVPTVETRCVPVVEETLTTVPVKQKVIKHVIQDRIRTTAEPWGGCALEKTLGPSSTVPIGLDHLCKC